jgi:ribosomal protein S18 acetylase RimI-like enzyme
MADMVPGTGTIDVVTAADEAAVAEVRQLFTEYAEWMSRFVTASTIGTELATLPAPFQAPYGRLLLAKGASGEACGCVGVKRHDERTAEIKRLYVRPECRGVRLGFALFSAALDAACELGYATAVVSTVPDQMQTAASMYARLGFEPTERFEDHTHADVELRYLRYDLSGWCETRSRGGTD